MEQSKHFAFHYKICVNGCLQKRGIWKRFLGSVDRRSPSCFSSLTSWVLHWGTIWMMRRRTIPLAMDESSVWSRACVQVCRPCCSLKNSIPESSGSQQDSLSHLFAFPSVVDANGGCFSFEMQLLPVTSVHLLWSSLKILHSSQTWVLSSWSQSCWLQGCR